MDELIQDGYLKTPALIRAFEKVNRKDFVGIKNEKNAYLNQPLSIGEGQTISQPLTVAFMLELLEPKPREKILEIGAGSGWQTALLKDAVGENGKIISLERIELLYLMARKNLEKYYTLNETLRVLHRNGLPGYPEESPYDKIIAAAAGETVPATWKEQLKIGGRLVMPVGENIVVLDKKTSQDFGRREYYGFRFVPLVS